MITYELLMTAYESFPSWFCENSTPFVNTHDEEGDDTLLAPPASSCVYN